MIAKRELWYRQDVASQVAPAARGAIGRHKRAGHAIVLATGSTVYAARAAAADVGIEHVLASALEVDAGRFTGRASALCFGHHKDRPLAERWAAEHGVDLARSVFYSDSYNDLPLLARVGKAVAVNPDTRLRRHARRVGWEIVELVA